MKLLLFDIDGTLIDSGRAGTRALNRAFHRVFKVEDGFEGIRMAGKTDPQIIREAVKLREIEKIEETIEELHAAYLSYLPEELENPEKKVHPGIAELLETLSERKDLCLGLLTGNIEKGARLKLEALGLNRFFPMGAFGSDNEDRNRLLPIALDRFESRCTEKVTYADCVIIGDTPRDIECSKPYGARVFCVATGPYPVDVLLAHGADAAVEDLSDNSIFINFLDASPDTREEENSSGSSFKTA